MVYNKYVNLNVHDFVLQQMDSVCFASSEGCDNFFSVKVPGASSA